MSPPAQPQPALLAGLRRAPSLLRLPATVLAGAPKELALKLTAPGARGLTITLTLSGGGDSHGPGLPPRAQHPTPRAAGPAARRPACQRPLRRR